MINPAGTIIYTANIGSVPLGVVISPDGAKAYVKNRVAAGTVSEITISSNTITDTIGVGASPAGIAVTPSGAKLYVANLSGTNDEVSVIQTSTNTVYKHLSFAKGVCQHH